MIFERYLRLSTCCYRTVSAILNLGPRKDFFRVPIDGDFFSSVSKYLCVHSDQLSALYYFVRVQPPERLDYIVTDNRILCSNVVCLSI